MSRYPLAGGAGRTAPAIVADGCCLIRREVAAVQGWCSVEDLIRWGFGQAPVVMANEAHSGLARCIRTREMGVRMIRAAHEAGVRRLAMEALPWPDKDTPGPIRAIPSGAGGYLAQPDMRRLITTALDLDWSLWAYEAVIEITPDTDRAELLTTEFTNWREREQAGHLCRLAAAPRPSPCWSGAATATPARHVMSASGCRWGGISAPCPGPTRSSSTRP